jgi:hypothetical protein
MASVVPFRRPAAGNHWSDEDVRVLKYSIDILRMTAEEIAPFVARSPDAVRRKAAEIGRTFKPRTASFLAQLIETEGFEANGVYLPNDMRWIELRARIAELESENSRQHARELPRE